MYLYKFFIGVILLFISQSLLARDYYRLADGELLMTGKGVTRSEVIALVNQQRRVEKLAKNRYLLEGAVRGKFIVEFTYKHKKLVAIKSQQAK